MMVIAVSAAIWRVRASKPAAPSHGSQPTTQTPFHSVDCAPPSAWIVASKANQASLYALAWSPFGKLETGWATYAPLISREIGAACPADSAAFAAKYAQWQARKGLPVDGIFKPGDFEQLNHTLELRRPFVQLTAKGLCPAAPDESTLTSARPAETFGGKAVRLRPGALAAYRRMVAAARTAGVGSHAPMLELISGYRSPTEEAARCEDGSCNTLTRATCSSHRTGLAMDLYLEPAPGADPTSASDENRRHMAGSLEYRWLVANADRFGFLPYAYEPWHWEWAGDAP